MFRCYITGRLSKLGEKANKIVVKTRPRQYMKKLLNEDTGQYETVVVSTGWEIVQEVNATAEGLAIWNANQKLDTSLEGA